MMNYEIFKEVVAEKFMDYMPEQYQGMRLRVEPVNKVNKVLDGITLVGSGAGRSVSPTLYINHMYEHYLETENLQEVLQSAARRMDMAFKEMPEVGDVNLEGAKDNIVFQVINTLQNEDMLRDMPHREFQDLSIIYRWVVKVDENGIQSSAIRNNLAEQLGMNEIGVTFQRQLLQALSTDKNQFESSLCWLEEKGILDTSKDCREDTPEEEEEIDRICEIVEA